MERMWRACWSVSSEPWGGGAAMLRDATMNWAQTESDTGQPLRQHITQCPQAWTVAPLSAQVMDCTTVRARHRMHKCPKPPACLVAKVGSLSGGLGLAGLGSGSREVGCGLATAMAADGGRDGTFFTQENQGTCQWSPPPDQADHRPIHGQTHCRCHWRQRRQAPPSKPPGVPRRTPPCKQRTGAKTCCH